MLPSTVERVPGNTREAYNAAIRRQTEENVARLAAAGPAAIERRLAELDREWDIERTLEANAATVSLVGSALGFSVDRRFFALPVVVAGFLLQHALQGWCPPVSLFRHLGFRTAREIDDEWYALKALRGDFHNIRLEGDQTGRRPEQALEAARR
jgi:hypothetical protein